MGGLGSGDWCRLSKRVTVEGSLSLGVGDFRGGFKPYSAGTFTWTRAGTVTGSISYSVNRDTTPPTVELRYRWRDQEDIQLPIRLQTTRPTFGGHRWWFTCPLIVSGVACNRRVGKLYLPPGARYFGCRRCYSLSYESCQEAHQLARCFDRLAQLLPDGGNASRLAAARGLAGPEGRVV